VKNAIIGECDRCEKILMTNDDWHHENQELWCDPCAEAASDRWQEDRIS